MPSLLLSPPSHPARQPRPHRTRRIFSHLPRLLVALLIATPWPALAQPGFEEAGGLGEANVEAKVSAYLSHMSLPVGSEGTLLVLLDVPPDFHIQINEFLEVTVDEEAPVTLGALTVKPNARWHEDGVLKGKTSMTLPVMVRPDASTGVTSITFVVGYQGCIEAPTYACFPPNWVEVTLNLDILPAGSKAVAAHEDIFALYGLGLAGGAPGEKGPAEHLSLEQRLNNALQRGSFLAFLLVFVGGILASFTPCVYPMIPITISYVGGRAASRTHGFILSLFFVLGIAITYAALGLLAAGTGAVFGAMMQSAAAIIIVAAIFAAMGASMLGAFDLVLPSSFTTGMQTASAGTTGGGKGRAVMGAILMGATTGLVASPCVGPVLVVLLAFVAKTGNLFYGFWLLFTFACGLGLLFLILGTFAGAINALPGAGSWMDTVKHVFGVILLAMAIYYLRNVLPPPLTRFLAGVFLVMVGVFTGAFHPLPAEPVRRLLFRKALGILIFLAGTVVFLAWMFHLVGFPLVGAGTQAALPGTVAQMEPAWRVNDEPALEEARAQGRPAIMDFWATWCAACNELDEKTWIDPRIYEESKSFVTVKMDLTKNDEFAGGVRARRQVVGMPTVIFYDGQGNEAARFSGFKGPDEVLEIMRGVR
jgi:thiol:disulfide interchange protein DsbD